MARRSKALRGRQSQLLRISGYVPGMSESPGDRLKAARTRAGFPTAAEAARQFGWHPQNVRDHEANRRGISADQAASYARAFKVSPTWILYGKGAEVAPAPAGEGAPLNPADGLSHVQLTRNVPVVGEVRAGAWAEVFDAEPRSDEVISVHLPEYERAQLFALRVSGPSMNKLYPDGTIVICVPAAEAGVRENDIVVVRRRRGSLVETTLKQIASDAQGVALWPRSTDPAFQEPLRIEAARDADEGPEIIGVVVSFQGRVLRSGPPMVL